MTTPTTPTHDFAPRESRYAIQPGRTVPVAIKRTNSEKDQTIAGELINLSRGGAKLSVQQCVPFSETIELTVNLTDADIQLALTAEVCWTRPAEEDCWQIGCSFGTPLPEEVLNKLAASFYLERRHSDRQLTSISATARSELRGTGTRVEISNFSAGGFCLRCAEPDTIGEHVLVEFKRPNESRATIHARVQWRLNSGGECLLGCAFVNGKDVNYMHETASEVAAQLPPVVDDRETAPAKPPAMWLKGAAAIVIGVACAGLLYAVTLWLVPADKPMKPIQVATTKNPAARHGDLDRTSAQTSAISDPSDSGGAGVEPAGNSQRSDSAGGVPVNHVVDSEPSVDDLDLDFSALEEATLPETPVADDRYTKAAQTGEEPEEPQIEITDIPLDEPERDQPNTEDIVIPSVDFRPVADAVQRLLSAVESQADQQTVEPQAARPSVAQAAEPAMEEDPPAPIAPSESVAASDLEPEEKPEPEVEPELEREPLVPFDPKTAAAAFVQGQDYYRRRQFSNAVDSFSAAAKSDPANPLYRYLLALSQFELGRDAEAQRSVEAAAQLERLRPIANWGTTLQRYQGTARIWLENARRKLIVGALGFHSSDPRRTL